MIASFGADISGDPVIAVVDDVVHVWATDGQRRLRHWWLERSRPWQGEVWGADVVGRPSVVLAGRAPRVFTRSVAGAVERWISDGPARVRREHLGDGALADPTAIWFYDQEHVFTATRGVA